MRTRIVTLVLLCGLAGCSRPADKEARFLKRGKAALENKDYARAQLEFNSAIQVMPKDAEPYYQLALVYLARPDLQNAVRYLTKATQLNPAHADAQLRLAALMTTSRDQKYLMEAEDRVKGVLAATPNNPQALDTLAAAELRLGQVDDAVKHLEEAFAKAPQNVGAALSLARMKAAQKDLPGAEEVLKKLETDAPKSAPAALLLAHFYLTSGRKDEGAAQVKRALELDPKNPDGLMLQAALQIDAGHPDQAEQTYRDLSASSKDHKATYAVYLFREGKRTQAVTELEKIVKQDPDNRDYRNLLVSAYVRQDQLPEAQKVVAAALKHNPNDVDALLQRADFYTRDGKTREAEQDLRAILHFKPESALAHYGLATVNGLKGSELTQRQELSEAIRLDPNLLNARLELASLMRIGSAHDALTLLDQTPERQRNTVAYMVTRNWVLLAMDKNEEVAANLSVALAKARVPEFVYQDALVKINKKDYTGARQSLEEVLKTYPESTSALNALTQSYASAGQMPKAIEVLTDRVSQKPKSAPLHNLLGDWLLKAGRRGEARAEFSAALGAAPGYMPATLALTEMDGQDGNLDSARKRIAPIVASHPENIQARLLMGQIADSSGDHAGAIEQYRAVTERDPKNLVALNNLAYSLTRDNPDEALKYAQSALELAPEEPAAQDTLGWIYYRKGIYREAITYLKRAVDKQATPPREYHLGMAYAKVGEDRLSRQYVSSALGKDPSLKGSENGSSPISK